MIHDIELAPGMNVRDLLSLAWQHKEDRRVRLWIADLCAHFMGEYEKGNYRPTTIAALEAVRRFARSQLSQLEMIEAAGNAHGDAYVVMPSYETTISPAPSGAFLVVGVAYAAIDASPIGIANAARTANLIIEYIQLEDEKIAERQWQFDRLIARLSDPEPEDWPLPYRKTS